MKPSSIADVIQVVKSADRLVLGCEIPACEAPEARGAIRLDMTGVSGTVDINPDNLSATFLAGTTLAEIDDALSPHGLWWPVDAAAARTLGGVLAGNGPYPGRTGYGPTRDWVLGMELILAGGEQMRVGGQTMKNVAGYDLTRLMIGSRGTLGVITAATLRLLPRPQRQVTVELPQRSHRAALDLSGACEWDGERLLVRLDGRPSQVERRLAALEAAIPGGVRVVGPEAWAPWYARAAGRYVRRLTPDWSTVGAPLVDLWRTDEPFRLSPLEQRLRDEIAPNRCFNPHL